MKSKLMFLIACLIFVSPFAQADRFDEEDFAYGDKPILLTVRNVLAIPAGVRQVNFLPNRSKSFESNTVGIPNDSCALRLAGQAHRRHLVESAAFLLYRVEPTSNGILSRNGLFQGTYINFDVRDANSGMDIGDLVCDDDDTTVSFHKFKNLLWSHFSVEIYPF